jgi:hypothetical protein
MRIRVTTASSTTTPSSQYLLLGTAQEWEQAKKLCKITLITEKPIHQVKKLRSL